MDVINGRGQIVDFDHDAVVIGPGPGRPEISPVTMHAAKLGKFPGFLESV
ncbi:MAG: hypothetical protein CM15mP9_1940 [Methanobacteriota archaeon]|nr:MAG: hypothetical protein CM15mP9_1940 [Euryarchaeota archaeon]